MTITGSPNRDRCDDNDQISREQSRSSSLGPNQDKTDGTTLQPRWTQNPSHSNRIQPRHAPALSDRMIKHECGKSPSRAEDVNVMMWCMGFPGDIKYN